MHCIIPTSSVSRSQPASWQTTFYSIFDIPTMMSKPINRISARIVPPSQTTASRMDASQYSSNHAGSQPSITFTDLLDYSLQVYLQTLSISATQCISQLSRWQPPSLHNHDLQVHLQTCLIPASKCFSKLTQLPPPSVPLISHHYGLQVRTIIASKCISKLSGSRPPNASLSSLDLSVHVHLQIHLITATKHIFNKRLVLYGEAGVNDVDRGMGSICSADPRVDRHHLVSISSYHTKKIHSIIPNFWFSLLCQRFCGFTQLHGTLTPGSIIYSNPIPRLLESEPLFLMNSLWT